ncbi:MAG: helix-turn-helix domain-containing protein, partial [Pseudomonadota bacterium]|nr:helix-turn-helix domain-containing protein [Pseudomonadota bacterium]
AINMARDLEWELFSGFTRSAIETLQSYEWPGNIRELKNVVERSLYRHGNEHIPVHQIILDPFASKFRPKQRVKAAVSSAPVANIEAAPITTTQNQDVVTLNKPDIQFPCNLKQLSNDFEIDVIKKALEHSQFNQKKTAEHLELTYHQLRGYLKKYNLLDQQQ